jgi:aryl-alcohol dehydrogenase (NADP+)
MQNHYNLLYREEEREMLPLCREAGLGVVPWSPLARGLLAGRRRSLADEPSERARSDDTTRELYDDALDQPVVEALVQVAGRRGLPPAQVALAWLLAQPGVTAPIVGATRLEHLEDAAAALDVRLDEAERQALEAAYRPHRVLGHR